MIFSLNSILLTLQTLSAPCNDFKTVTSLDTVAFSTCIVMSAPSKNPKRAIAIYRVYKNISDSPIIWFADNNSVYGLDFFIRQEDKTIGGQPSVWDEGALSVAPTTYSPINLKPGAEYGFIVSFSEIFTSIPDLKQKINIKKPISIIFMTNSRYLMNGEKGDAGEAFSLRREERNLRQGGFQIVTFDNLVVDWKNHK